MEELYFEDFTVGREFTSAGRTITETDVVLFASLTGDNNPMHTNDYVARRSMYGTRIVHGLLSLSIANGLIQRLNIMQEAGLAYLGISNCRFIRPVRLGDTVYAKCKVVNRRDTRKADQGIITYAILLYNEKGEEVLSSEHLVLVRKKSES